MTFFTFQKTICSTFLQCTVKQSWHTQTEGPTVLRVLQGFPADFVAVVGESAVRLIIGAGVRLSVVFVMKVGTILFFRWAGVTELQAGVGPRQRLVQLLVHLCLLSQYHTHSNLKNSLKAHCTHTKNKKRTEQRRWNRKQTTAVQMYSKLSFQWCNFFVTRYMKQLENKRLLRRNTFKVAWRTRQKTETLSKTTPMF